MIRKILLPLLLLGSTFVHAQKTLLSGTLKNPDGTGPTGYLSLSMSQVAGVSPNNSCGGPVQVVPNVAVQVSIVSGAISSYTVQGSSTVHSGAPHLYGSDCTLPAGVPYNAVLRDLQGNILFNQLWLIVGTTQDIGTVVANAINPQATYILVIPGSGAPTGVCSNNQVYNQQDATAGQNVWWCINGTWTQQVGQSGGGGSGYPGVTTDGANGLDVSGSIAVNGSVTGLNGFSDNGGSANNNLSHLSVTNSLNSNGFSELQGTQIDADLQTFGNVTIGGNLRTSNVTIVTNMDAIVAESPHFNGIEHPTSGTVGSTEISDFVDASGGAVSLTLPAATPPSIVTNFHFATADGQVLHIWKIDSSGNAITIHAGSGDTIAGSSTFVISAQYHGVTLMSDGNHTWFPISLP